MEGFSFYRVYQPIHLHLTGDFDCIKYNGKVNISEASYSRRRDKHFMERFGNKYENSGNVAQLCLANTVVKEYWLTDNPEELNKRYQRRKDFLRNPTKSISSEITTVMNTFPGKRLEDLTKGRIPPIIQLFSKGLISPELVVVTDSQIPFIDSCNDFWFVESNTKNRLTKFRPFVKIDDGLKNIINQLQGE